MQPMRHLLMLVILTGLAAIPAAIAQGDQNYPGQLLPARTQNSGYPPQQNYNYPAPDYNNSSSSYNNAYMTPQRSSQIPAAAPMRNGGTSMSPAQWFANYDQIRHTAQMTPAERQQADALLSRGLSLIMPGAEKQTARTLLTSLVVRYQRACQQLGALPQLTQTQAVHQSYYYYFANAAQLFRDYVRVQDNLFLGDANGQPLAGGLMQRKQMLEGLERQAKALDAQSRTQCGIAPYRY